ncbi:hypothetical protein [Planococcus shenhongbingii]|uniref:hypothetical protein n=1 Tax=Planococcus shenhongbingii TaxID=3058398 RepID=UPI00265AD15C|nr:hypothetical protein [Planococcus sp. N017]
MDDQDNWRYVGPAEPRFFINVLMESGEVVYTLSRFENVDAIYYEGFYDKEAAIKKLRWHGYDFREEQLQ